MVEVRVRENSTVNWIPVELRYHYKSKYPMEGQPARRRDHDFKIELEAVIRTRMPHELICSDHLIVREEVEYKVFTDTVTHYYATLRYDNIEYVAHFTEFDLKNHPKDLIYRIADDFKQVVGRRLSKKTIIEWLKMDMAYYFPDYYPEERRYVNAIIRVNIEIYGHPRYYPLLIRNIESVDEPIEIEKEDVTPYYIKETAEDFRQGLEHIVSIVLERLTEEFLRDVYMFPLATEFKFESGVEACRPECNPSTTDIITDSITATYIIEDETQVVSAMMLRANNIADNPREYDYWSTKYEEFLASNVMDIAKEIVDWYERWYENHFRGGE